MPAAAVLFVSGSRVPLLERSWSPGLVRPGGIIEAGETARAAAEREVNEELGVSVTIGQLLVHDRRPGFDHYVFIGGEALSGLELAPDYGGEIAALYWLPFDVAVQRHSPRGSQRVKVALDAARDGMTVVSERELVDSPRRSLYR